MRTTDIKPVVTQDNSQSSTQPPLANQQIKCVSPMTFSQKLYKFNELEIAEEYERALEVNSLEKIKNLLDKLVELSN